MAFFKPVDYLDALWPCEGMSQAAQVDCSHWFTLGIRRRLADLRAQVVRACETAGLSPPPLSPAEFGTVQY